MTAAVIGAVAAVVAILIGLFVVLLQPLVAKHLVEVEAAGLLARQLPGRENRNARPLSEASLAGRAGD